MSHYLIKFRPRPSANAEIVGCLRFSQETTYEERQESLKRWQAKHRPHQPTLQSGEWMWLDEVKVEDAP
jgi:hypothetical protein